MKKRTKRAIALSYLGAALTIGGFLPNLDSYFTQKVWLHALWYVAIFIGGALLVYGLETLRKLARRSPHAA